MSTSEAPGFPSSTPSKLERAIIMVSPDVPEAVADTIDDVADEVAAVAPGAHEGSTDPT